MSPGVCTRLQRTNDKDAGINPALGDLGQDTHLTSLSLVPNPYETESLNQALVLTLGYCCCLFWGLFFFWLFVFDTWFLCKVQAVLELAVCPGWP